MLSGYSNNIIPDYGIAPVKQNKSADAPVVNVYPKSNSTLPSFRGNANIAFRASLSTKEEKEQYKHLTKHLDNEGRKQLNVLLKNGTLLKNGANDNSTVLDNLYKMVSTPRARGMNADILLKHTIKTIADPYSITQRFGDIPEQYKDEVVGRITNYSKNLIERKVADYEIIDMYSGCCVAASEEFNLASRNPAEFARFAEGLTSPQMSVKKTIKMNSLSDKALDAIWLLNAFEIPYEAKTFNDATITLAPDKNAIIREQIQEHFQDPLERSPIDVLMQSTFMNVGSQQTYNTLNDRRGGKFSI